MAWDHGVRAGTGWGPGEGEGQEPGQELGLGSSRGRDRSWGPGQRQGQRLRASSLSPQPKQVAWHLAFLRTTENPQQVHSPPRRS